MTVEPIGVVVVDASTAIAGAFHPGCDPRVEVLGSTPRQAEAVRMIQERHPDVVIVDIELDHPMDFPFVRAIRDQFPDVAVVVHTELPEIAHAEAVLRAGALAYVPKSSAAGDLHVALKAAADREACLSQQATRRILTKMVRSRRHTKLGKLTRRERTVFELLGDSREVQTIADDLGLSRKTVGIYRRRIQEKLGLESVGELQVFARNCR